MSDVDWVDETLTQIENAFNQRRDVNCANRVEGELAVAIEFSDGTEVFVTVEEE